MLFKWNFWFEHDAAGLYKNSRDAYREVNYVFQVSSQYEAS